MKHLHLLIALVIFAAGCSKSSDSTPSTAPGAINPKEYSKLLAMDTAGLARKAQVGELGNCVMKNLGRGRCGGPYDTTYVLFIVGKEIYYPAMSFNSDDSASCFDTVAGNIRTALSEGFCYANHDDLNQMPKESLARKAQAGDLGNCVMKNLGRGRCGGPYDTTYVLFIQNKNVFYPAMTPSSDDSASCWDAVAGNAKNAFDEGFCL